MTTIIGQSAGGGVITARRSRVRQPRQARYTGASIDSVLMGVKSMIIATATDGLVSAGKYTLMRAQHYAPVRNVFKDTRGVEKRNRFTVGGSLQQGASEGVAGKKGVFIRTPEQMNRFKKSRLTGRRIAPESGAFGRPSDFKPVIRVGDELRAGDFRKLSQGPNGPRLASVKYESSQGSGMARGSGNKALSARGRYELRRQRAFFSGEEKDDRRVDPAALSSNAKGRLAQGTENQSIRIQETRLGGRLRGEIYVTPVSRRGSFLWVWVVSPTPYARYQEFGTQHNRAHPFLRPALYDARRFFPQAIKSAFRQGRRVSPRFKTGTLSVGR